MSKFVDTVIDLGEVKPGQVVKPLFKFIGEQKVKSTSVKCNCLKVRVQKDGVTIEYTVADIPYHLSQHGIDKLHREKDAQILFEDDTQEELKFKFIIIK